MTRLHTTRAKRRATGEWKKKDGALRNRGANEKEDDKSVADVTWARRAKDAKRLKKNADSGGNNEKEEHGQHQNEVGGELERSSRRDKKQTVQVGDDVDGGRRRWVRRRREEAGDAGVVDYRQQLATSTPRIVLELRTRSFPHFFVVTRETHALDAFWPSQYPRYLSSGLVVGMAATKTCISSFDIAPESRSITYGDILVLASLYILYREPRMKQSPT
jgi:hypothetical protein